jgi:hypothetical protein
LNFLNIFLEKAPTSNLIKIHPMGARLLHADGLANGQDKYSLFAILRTCLKIEPNAGVERVNG